MPSAGATVAAAAALGQGARAAAMTAAATTQATTGRSRRVRTRYAPYRPMTAIISSYVAVRRAPPARIARVAHVSR